MGYDLHITRKAHWCDDDGPSIDEAEWRRVVQEDPELSFDPETQCSTAHGEYLFAAWKGNSGSLGWCNGEITAKNPDQPLIGKMIEIAGRLGANVQGDDGELYGVDRLPAGDLVAAQPLKSRLFDRLAAWLRPARTAPTPERTESAFRVGQRVQNPWGDRGIIVEVDPSANDGLGRVRVQLDDGREHSVACVASGLEIIADETPA